MVGAYSDTSISGLQTLADMHIRHVPNFRHTQALAFIRDELKARRFEAKARLKEIEDAEVYIAAQIMYTRRKRAKERQAI